jgi:hypothetical protein
MDGYSIRKCPKVSKNATISVTTYPSDIYHALKIANQSKPSMNLPFLCIIVAILWSEMS